MSTLTISLLLLFVLVLAGVILYNRAQVARRRRGDGPLLGSGERSDRGSLAGVSTGMQRTEPRLAERTEGAEESAPGADPVFSDASLPAVAVEPEFDTAIRSSAVPVGPASVATASATASASRDRSPAAVLDDLCDCIVEIEFAQPLPGDRLLGAAQSFRRAGAKPVVLEALPVEFAPGDEALAPIDEPWEPIETVQHYSALRAGILLANRHGPLNPMEFSDFVAGVHRLGDQFGTIVELPDMNRVLEQARLLDATSAQLDTQVGLNIEVPEVPGADVLERLAPSLGLLERGNNRFARLGERGEVVFSLALSDQPNRLTLLLDVPRVPATVEPWGQLVAVALRAAQRLGGTIVDDDGRALVEEDLVRIGERLEERYRALDAAGLRAGSRAAKRVFN